MALIQRMVRVRLITGGESDEEVISVSLENNPKILFDVRRALPSLRREMRKRWPTLSDVQIRHRLPRVKNPVDPHASALLTDARVILAAIFTSQIAAEFTKEVIRPPAKEIGEYLRRWVQRFTKSKSRRRTKRRREKR
jgi:hypothetical protein